MCLWVEALSGGKLLYAPLESLSRLCRRCGIIRGYQSVDESVEYIPIHVQFAEVHLAVIDADCTTELARDNLCGAVKVHIQDSHVIGPADRLKRIID